MIQTRAISQRLTTSTCTNNTKGKICNGPFEFAAKGATSTDPFVIGSPVGHGLFAVDQIGFVADLSISGTCGTQTCTARKGLVGFFTGGERKPRYSASSRPTPFRRRRWPRGAVHPQEAESSARCVTGSVQRRWLESRPLGPLFICASNVVYSSIEIVDQRLSMSAALDHNKHST